MESIRLGHCDITYEEIIDSWIADYDIDEIDKTLYDRLIKTGFNKELVTSHNLISDKAKKNFIDRFDHEYYQELD